MTYLALAQQDLGNFEESLDTLETIKRLFSHYDMPESGPLAKVESILTATHFYLNDTNESIEHAKETLKRVQAMQEVDPKNIGESAIIYGEVSLVSCPHVVLCCI